MLAIHCAEAPDADVKRGMQLPERCQGLVDPVLCCTAVVCFVTGGTHRALRPVHWDCTGRRACLVTAFTVIIHNGK
jgi:hypothetical protein